MPLNVIELNQTNFDEEVLPEDIWEGRIAEYKFEVKIIENVLSGRKTRIGQVPRQFPVLWKENKDLSLAKQESLYGGNLHRR